MTGLVWGGFLTLFLSLLFFDLGVLHRESATLSVRQALFWTGVWVSVAMSFAVVVYGLYEYHWFDFRLGPGAIGGEAAATQYVTGYLLEWSLSVDNIFVIAVIFSYLKIPTLYQYRVLFWGIVGAIVLRGLMIAAGTTLLHHFDWMFYVFGAILLLSAVRMLREHEEVDFGTTLPARLVQRFVPVTEKLERARFFVRQDGRLYATPLFVALLMVEMTDVVFAVDSIPAILAVTRDPFLVFTSNAFAILGLRSLYFAVAGMMALFKYLKYSLVMILAFVGVKMMLINKFHVPDYISLGIIIGTLAGGVLASLWATRRETGHGPWSKD